MLNEKEREAINRIIKILQENEGAADILGIKIENLITLRDCEPQLPRHTPLQKTKKNNLKPLSHVTTHTEHQLSQSPEFFFHK